jgi:hypothetical protein
VSDFTFEIVANQACPLCGCDGSNSEYPNRPKVHDGDAWWWRCYDPNCMVDYYNPETGAWDRVLTPEEQAAMDKRVAEKYGK